MYHISFFTGFVLRQSHTCLYSHIPKKQAANRTKIKEIVCYFGAFGVTASRWICFIFIAADLENWWGNGRAEVGGWGGGLVSNQNTWSRTSENTWRTLHALLQFCLYISFTKVYWAHFFQKCNLFIHTPFSRYILYKPSNGVLYARVSLV